jgi:hypothetical protein
MAVMNPLRMHADAIDQFLAAHPHPAHREYYRVRGLIQHINAETR